MIRYVTDADIVFDDPIAHQEEEITDDSPNTEQSENVASLTNNNDTPDEISGESAMMLSENDATLARFLIT